VGRGRHADPKDAKPNTFGGWKFNVMMDGLQITIDVWPGDRRMAHV